jgi:hypothetical protein
MKKSVTSCALVLTMLMVGAGCGGSDDASSELVQGAPDAVDDSTPEAEATTDAQPDGSGEEAAVGFGELIEGTFLLSGAAEEQYFSTDEELDFRMSGGCQDGAFGFGTNVQDVGGTTTFATFGAQGQEDLSGGATGEFDAVDLEVTVFPGGDMSVSERYEGPVRMIISEHDTGGVDADLNARRMTVTLLGSIPGDEGDVDVDVTYRWVMGCP